MYVYIPYDHCTSCSHVLVQYQGLCRDLSPLDQNPLEQALDTLSVTRADCSDARPRKKKSPDDPNVNLMEHKRFRKLQNVTKGKRRTHHQMISVWSNWVMCLLLNHITCQAYTPVLQHLRSCELHLAAHHLIAILPGAEKLCAIIGAAQPRLGFQSLEMHPVWTASCGYSSSNVDRRAGCRPSVCKQISS